MSADGAALRIIALLDELADLKFDVERLEKAVDVLAASVNAATIRAEKAEAEVARLRGQEDEWRADQGRKQRRIDQLTGLLRDAESDGVDWEHKFRVALTRAEKAEADIARVRALIRDWERLGYGGYLTPQVSAAVDGEA